MEKPGQTGQRSTDKVQRENKKVPARAWIFVRCVCYVLWNVLCDELITRLEEFWVCVCVCVCVCVRESEISRHLNSEAAKARAGAVMPQRRKQKHFSQAVVPASSTDLRFEVFTALTAKVADEATQCSLVDVTFATNLLSPSSG